MPSASATVIDIGFCTLTCAPARMAATAISAWRGCGRQDVDEVRLEAQELVEASHELRLREERGSPVEQILTAVAERDDHRVRVVAVAEAVQVEDAAEPDDADANGTRHREKLPSAGAARRHHYCSGSEPPPEARPGTTAGYPRTASVLKPAMNRRARTRNTPSPAGRATRHRHPHARRGVRDGMEEDRTQYASTIAIGSSRPGSTSGSSLEPGRTPGCVREEGEPRARRTSPVTSRRRLDRNLAGRQS